MITISHSLTLANYNCQIIHLTLLSLFKFSLLLSFPNVKLIGNQLPAAVCLYKEPASGTHIRNPKRTRLNRWVWFGFGPVQTDGYGSGGVRVGL